MKNLQYNIFSLPFAHFFSFLKIPYPYLLELLTNILLEIISVEIQHKVVNKVVSIAHNNQRQLIGQLGLLQEVLDALRGITVALPADTLHLLNLSGLAGSLDILKMDLGILEKKIALCYIELSVKQVQMH